MEPNPSAGRRRGWLGWIVVFGATLVAYWPVMRAGYVWDDVGSFVTAPPLRSWAGLVRIWTDPSVTEQYYPLLHSMFWIEHRLWGDAPLGYHLLNVLLHATACCLFGQVLLRLDLGRAAAWFGALLFALHPVCVESVAWIAEQKNTLSTVFYMLAVLAYLRFEDRRPRGGGAAAAYVLATALFGCALLCKTVTATLPGALLVLLWWRDGRLGWRDARPLVPWFAAGAAAGLFSGWVERTYIGASGPEFALNFAGRCVLAGRATWFYLGKAVWPANLIFIYPKWKIDPAVAWQYAWAVGAAALIGALWGLRRRTRAPLAAAMIFIGSLFPTLGFLNVFAFFYSYVADHWQYLALPGVIALAAGGWGRWLERSSASGVVPLLPICAAAPVPAIFGILAWGQAGIYRNAVVFYETILRRNPDCWMADNNYGRLLEANPRSRPEAYALFRAGLRLKPDFPELHVNLGNLYFDETGNAKYAKAEYETALRLSPDFAVAHYNLARLLAAQPGGEREAERHYRTALRIQPGFLEARSNLAELLTRIPGRMPEAVALYEAVLRADPNNANAHCALADALVQMPGRPTDGIVEYERALRLQPNLPVAHNNLAAQLARIPGRQLEAVAHLEKAVELDPGYGDAHDNLAAAYAALGRWGDAARQLEIALRLNPNDREARARLEQLRAAAR